MKLCKKALHEMSPNNIAPGRGCLECKRAYNRGYQEQHRDRQQGLGRKRYHLHRESIIIRTKANSAKRLAENRAYFLRQVGGKCEKCGWNEVPAVLQFDHIVPLRNAKAPRFSQDLRAFHITNPRLWNHFNLVQVLCPNCHAVKTKIDLKTSNAVA